jgi:hypothetical protein
MNTFTGQYTDTSAAPARAASRPSDPRDPPMFQDDYLEDGKGLDKFRRNGTQPGDRQPEDGPAPTPHVLPNYDPYPDGYNPRDPNSKPPAKGRARS